MPSQNQTPGFRFVQGEAIIVLHCRGPSTSEKEGKDFRVTDVLVRDLVGFLPDNIENHRCWLVIFALDLIPIALEFDLIVQEEWRGHD